MFQIPRVSDSGCFPSFSVWPALRGMVVSQSVHEVAGGAARSFVVAAVCSVWNVSFPLPTPVLVGTRVVSISGLP